LKLSLSKLIIALKVIFDFTNHLRSVSRKGRYNSESTWELSSDYSSLYIT